MILLKMDPYLGIFLIFLAIALGPPLVLAILGFVYLNKKPKVAKVLFIVAGVYVLVGAGFCGLMSM